MITEATLIVTLIELVEGLQVTKDPLESVQETRGTPLRGHPLEDTAINTQAKNSPRENLGDLPGLRRFHQ